MSYKPPTLISYENSSEDEDNLKDKVVYSYYSHTVLETNIDENSILQLTSINESSLTSDVYTSPRSQVLIDDNMFEKKMLDVNMKSLEKSLTNDFEYIDNNNSVIKSYEEIIDPSKPKSSSVSPERVKFDISDSDKEHNEIKDDLRATTKRKKKRSSRKNEMTSLKRLVSYGQGAGDTTIHDDEDEEEEESPSGSSSPPDDLSPPPAAASPLPLSQRDRILASAEQHLIASAEISKHEMEEVDQIEPNEIRPPPPAPSVARNRDTSGNWSDYIFDEDDDNFGAGELNKGEGTVDDGVFSLQTDASTALHTSTSTVSTGAQLKDSAASSSEILLEQFGNPIPQATLTKAPRVFWDPLGPVWSLAAGLQKIYGNDPTSIERSIDELLPEPPGRCSEALQAKFRTFYERAAREARSDPNAFNALDGSVNAGAASLDMNAVICDNKAFRNPSIYEKLLQYCDIDDSGTNAIPDPAYFASPTPGVKKRDAPDSKGGIYNVKRATGKRLWAAASFYEELARAQKAEMERWEKERTIQRSALNAAAPTCATASSSVSLPPTINSAPPVTGAPIIGTSVSVSIHERSSVKLDFRKTVAETTGSKKKRRSGSPEKESSRSPGKNNYSAAFNNPFGISPSTLQNVKTRKSKWDKPAQEEPTASETFEPARPSVDS